MVELTLEIPEDLAQHLESLATAQNKSMEQVALDHLRSLDSSPGSPSAILRAMKQPPHPDSSIVDELEAAIRDGRLTSGEQNIFEE